MSFKIDTFTAKLSKGGALASLFECELTAAKGSGSTIGDFKFLCKGATFPASTIEAATITYMGRAMNIPGNRAATQLTTSVYNDEGMEIRNHIENWMELLNSHSTNKRAAGYSTINSYTGSLKVKQLSKEGTGITKTYEFIDAWPSSCGEIALSWDTNDIQSFDVTWDCSYWRSTESAVGY
jgi:hypothetical protein